MEIPLEDVEVTLTFKANLPPGDDPLAIERTRRLRIAKIRREVRLLGPLDDEQRAALMKEAACCPVSNTLAHAIQIEDVALP